MYVLCKERVSCEVTCSRCGERLRCGHVVVWRVWGGGGGGGAGGRSGFTGAAARALQLPAGSPSLPPPHVLHGLEGRAAAIPFVPQSFSWPETNTSYARLWFTSSTAGFYSLLMVTCMYPRTRSHTRERSH